MILHCPKHNTSCLQRVVEFEEAEAQLRPAEKDATLFKKLCHDIRQIFSDIAELKSKDTVEVIAFCNQY